MFKSITVDQIVRLPLRKRIRVFRVTGVYLGSEKEEDLIGIECLDIGAGNCSGKVIKEMLVPRDIIELMICSMEEDKEKEQ